MTDLRLDYYDTSYPPSLWTEEPEPLEAAGPYDPADHHVDEVKAYVEENPDEAEVVLQAETAGKNRSTLVAWLEEQSG